MNQAELIKKIAYRDYRIEEGVLTLKQALEIMEKRGEIDLIKEGFREGQKSNLDEVD